MRIILFLLPVFLLVGCAAVSSPTFWPSSYAYHNDEYKAQPGPKAADVGYEYSVAKSAEIAAQWQNVVDDLVDQLEQQSEIAPDDIYIASAVGNAFNASFDHALRTAFIKRGYRISGMDDALYSLAYEARALDDPKAAPKDNIAPEQDFTLSLSLQKAGALLGTGAGVYALPVYGYEYKDGDKD